MNWLFNNVYEWLMAIRIGQVKNWQWGNTYHSFLGVAGDPSEQVFAASGVDGIWASRDGAGWKRIANFSGTDHDHFAMHFADSIWVSVGRSELTDGHKAEARYTSSNDPFGTWNLSTVTGAAVDTALRGVAYGNSVWVAVGDNAEIVSAASPPTTWTRRTAAGSYSGDFQDVWFDATLSLFIAVGSGGEIQYSSDGTTWSQGTADGSYSDIFYGVCSDGLGTIVAVGENGEIQKSTNGSTWATQTNPEGITLASDYDDWAGIHYAEGCFVICAAEITINAGDVFLAISEDGESWELASVPVVGAAGKGMDGPSDIGFNGSRWIVVGGPTSADYLLLGLAFG
jgi:hypothetical protein